MKSLPATRYHAQQGALMSATKNKCVSFQGSDNFFCASSKTKPDQNVDYSLKHFVEQIVCHFGTSTYLLLSESYSKFEAPAS